jgi:hypothetical protein
VVLAPLTSLIALAILAISLASATSGRARTTEAQQDRAEASVTAPDTDASRST